MTSEPLSNRSSLYRAGAATYFAGLFRKSCRSRSEQKKYVTPRYVVRGVVFGSTAVAHVSASTRVVQSVGPLGAVVGIWCPACASAAGVDVCPACGSALDVAECPAWGSAAVVTVAACGFA